MASPGPEGGAHGHDALMEENAHYPEEDIDEGVEGEADVYSDEDEDMASSDDEEYNLTHFGIAQALPVPEGPPDLSSGPPQTAEEYLQWVRYEASQCPRVTRKEVDPEKLARRQQQLLGQQQGQEGHGQSSASGSGAAAATEQGGPSGKVGRASGVRRGSTTFAAQTPPPVTSDCQEWARPSPKWLRVFLQDFYRLRQTLGAMQRHHARELAATQLPSLDNTAAWDRLCFKQWEPLESNGTTTTTTTTAGPPHDHHNHHQVEHLQGAPQPHQQGHAQRQGQQEQGQQGQGQQGLHQHQALGAIGTPPGSAQRRGSREGHHRSEDDAPGSQQESQNEGEEPPSPPPPPPPPPAPLDPALEASAVQRRAEAAGTSQQHHHHQHQHSRHRQQQHPGHNHHYQRHGVGEQGGPAERDGGGDGGGAVGSETDRLCGPVVRTVLSLDQVSVGLLIQRHVALLATQPCLSYIRSQWLFALAAVLERPVPPDVAAAMRDLVRRCSAWRAALAQPDDPSLPRLNVLLAVAGGYFGQDEHLSAAVAVAGLGDLA